ncbi:PAS domain S-box protein, partial [bacterium]|nr:PAS domain S-box protein [bacterium]
VHTIPFRDQSGEWLVAEFNIDINDRKKAELELRQSEQRYRMLVEQLPDAVYIYDGDRFAFANKAGIDLLGARDGGQLLGRPLTEFLHPDFHRQAARRMATLYRKGDGVPLAEQRLVRMDGREIDIDVRTIPFPYLGKTMALAIARDITEVKRAERAVRENEERFNKAFRNSPIVMVITGLADGLVIDVNDEFTRLFRVKPGQVIGKNTYQLGLWRDIAQRRGKLRTALDQGAMRNVPLEMTTWDGRRLSLLLSAETVAIGGKPCLLTSAFDVTESKRIDQALRQSEQALRTFIEQSADGIVILDERGRIAEWNRAQQRIYGIGRDRTVGRFFWDIQY